MGYSSNLTRSVGESIAGGLVSLAPEDEGDEAVAVLAWSS